MKPDRLVRRYVALVRSFYLNITQQYNNRLNATSRGPTITHWQGSYTSENVSAAATPAGPAINLAASGGANIRSLPSSCSMHG